MGGHSLGRGRRRPDRGEVLHVVQIELSWGRRQRSIHPAARPSPAPSSSHLPAPRLLVLAPPLGLSPLWPPRPPRPPAPPAAPALERGAGGLSLRGGEHKIAQAGPLGGASLGGRGPAGRAPPSAEGGATEGADATQALRRIGGFEFSPAHGRQGRGGGEELNPARTAVPGPAADLAAPALAGETGVTQGLGAGGLGGRGRPIGEGVAALLTKKVQKERHKVLSGDLQLHQGFGVVVLLSETQATKVRKSSERS